MLGMMTLRTVRIMMHGLSPEELGAGYITEDGAQHRRVAYAAALRAVRCIELRR
jgi:hypothetical protein